MNVGRVSLTIIMLLLLCVGVTAQETAAVSQGERIYNQTCVVCHGAGVGGAPRPGVPADWENRLRFGIEEVYLNVIEGMGRAMPPRGMCMDCSDAQIQAVVDFMTTTLH